jgi:hypothetical protein
MMGVMGRHSGPSRSGTEANSFDTLPDDVVSTILSHLTEDNLAAASCTGRRLLVLVARERARIRAEQRVAAALAKREARLEGRAARERFAKHEGDARVVMTVLRHCLIHAPAGLSVVTKENGRQQIVAPVGGVYRLRVGLSDDSSKLSADPARTERNVDVLAMGSTALRQVIFEGAPLGTAGAAVAVRQAAQLGLHAPCEGPVHGRVLKLFVRGDLLRSMIEASPIFARLLAGERE